MSLNSGIETMSLGLYPSPPIAVELDVIAYHSSICDSGILSNTSCTSCNLSGTKEIKSLELVIPSSDSSILFHIELYIPSRIVRPSPYGKYWSRMISTKSFNSICISSSIFVNSSPSDQSVPFP